MVYIKILLKHVIFKKNEIHLQIFYCLKTLIIVFSKFIYQYIENNIMWK